MAETGVPQYLFCHQLRLPSTLTSSWQNLLQLSSKVSKLIGWSLERKFSIEFHRSLRHILFFHFFFFNTPPVHPFSEQSIAVFSLDFRKKRACRGGGRMIQLQNFIPRAPPAITRCARRQLVPSIVDAAAGMVWGNHSRRADFKVKREIRMSESGRFSTFSEQ